MFGTAIAQAVPVLVSPIITRVYTPEDIGVFTLVMSVISFCAVVGSGRYEVAIMIPNDNVVARNLVAIAHFLGFIFCLILGIVVLTAHDAVGDILGLNPKDRHWLYWIPVYTFLAIYQQTLILYTARLKKFKVVALNKMGKTISMSVTQVIMGISKITGGLIWGNFVGGVTSVIFLKRKLKKLYNLQTPRNYLNTAKEYSKFPKYSLLADSINSFSNHVPIVMMIRFFSEGTAGYFGFTQRILSLPLGLIASSFTEVFRQRASEDYNKFGSCRPIYLKTLKKLSLISIPSFAVLALIAPQLFAFIFGAEWYESGRYASILSFMFALRFIASPLSYVLYVVGKQKYDLIWQVCLAVVTIVSFWAGGKLNNPELALWSFSLSYSFLYIIYILMSYRFSKER
nr:oligosaccharide flippase family protein [Roseivirga seohaensis]